MERETRELQSELRKTERAVEKGQRSTGKRKGKMIQQAYTKWSIFEATTGCIVSTNEEKEENVENRGNQKH